MVLSSRKSKVRVALVCAAAALALGACAGRGKKPSLTYEERPVELLYAAGADRLDRGQWSQAVDYFEEVDRQHPYSEWARRAILMTAYAHYMGNDYPEAVGDAERFIALYPGSPAAAYAYYLKAVCYFEQIVDVGRDQGATLQALSALQDVTQRFPNTEYAADARLKIDMVNDQLAGKEMTVGRWYLRNGETLAAIGRFRNVIDTYQTTSHTPEALYRLVEAYLTIGLGEEARRNGAVLGHNFPGDVWYRDAYDLLAGKGLQPATARPSGGFLPRIPLPWGRHKEITVKPPGVAQAPAAPAPSAEAAATPAATQ
ncbi:MAG: outer membrane protein assembly factor BamD [Phenylobacterium sp.]